MKHLKKLRTGTVHSWNIEKAFGFIKLEKQGKDLFFHINDYNRKFKDPEIGLKVIYIVSQDDKGRNCAINVSPKAGHKKNTKATKQLKFALILSFIFISMLGILISLQRLPIQILYVYLAMSLFTFLLYFKDKRAAQKGNWRTPESSLHVCSLLCGWPGALIAQAKLRHKSSKTYFKVFLWFTILLNCFALAWLLTPAGFSYFEALFK